MGTVKSRKRGRKASRSKLDTAMLNAGIKTQTLLAEHIATNENLLIPPKDTVNRAFRQESVSPTTIARIARVLQVEAHSLYLTEAEKETVQINKLNDEGLIQSALRLRFLYKRITLVVLTLAAIIAIGWSLYSEKQVTEPDHKFHARNALLGKPSLVIISYSEATDPLAESLRNEMQQVFTATNISRTLVKNHSMAVDIAREYQSDGVLSLRQQTLNRFIGLQAYLFVKDTETLIWTNSLLRASLANSGKEITQQIIKSLNLAFDDPDHLNSNQFNFVEPNSQYKYLQAMDLLNNAESEINVKRAQTLLHSAIQKYPNYVNAITALCESFVEESWRGNEKEILQDAQRECDRAISIDPTNLYARSTLAYVYRRTGRLAESIRIYKDVLLTQPEDINANSGIASAYLEAYRQNLDLYPDAKKKMVEYSRITSALEPKYWRHHSNLGLFSYFSGNPELAADAFGVAAELNPNEMAFTNVGTINKCIGKIDKAEYYYRKAIEIAPESYIGKDYLGSVYFYLDKYAESAELKKTSTRNAK